MQFNETKVGERPEGRARKGCGAGAEAGSKCRGSNGPIAPEQIQNPHPQRRSDRTNAAFESLVQCVNVESDGDDIGDALRGRYFAGDHVRATWRHESANLRSNQLRHLGLPTEAESFALTAGSRHSGRRLE
ncbi:hypothetical protein ACOJVU_00045 [Mycobacterium sp. THU-M104]